jgi:hypothetical protein
MRSCNPLEPLHPAGLPQSRAGPNTGYNRPHALPSSRAAPARMSTQAKPSQNATAPPGSVQQPSDPTPQHSPTRSPVHNWQPVSSSPSLGDPIPRPAAQASNSSQPPSGRSQSDHPTKIDKMRWQFEENADRCACAAARKAAHASSTQSSATGSDTDEYLVQDGAHKIADAEAKKKARPVCISHSPVVREIDS